MTDQLISYETAVLAKEKGFDIPIQHTVDKRSQLYDIHKDVISINSTTVDNWNKFETVVSAPTQSLLQRWLREIHSLHIMIVPLTGLDNWVYSIHEDSTIDFKKVVEFNYNLSYKTYEEVLEKGLQEALKLIKS